MKFIVLCIFLASLSIRAETYHYTDISSGEVVEFEFNSNDVQIRYPTDVILKTENCFNENFKVCFFSRKFSLAIPVKIDVEKSWCVNSICYQSKGLSTSLKILNHTFDHVYIIESPASSTLIGRQKGKVIYWYYSEKNGVIAFQYSDDSRFFISSESYGFTSQQ